MSFCEIPPALDREIDELAGLIERRDRGEVDGRELKAHRVPFGVYEQRVRNSYMARIRCPGGAITPAQLRAVARLSRHFGSSLVHVTTRQELQIHDVKPAGIVPLLRDLRSAGLATRGGGGNTVRNITASWDSGIAPHEVFDVTPWAVALTNRLIAEPDSWLLPRKFKIAFSNSARDNAFATLNDLGFIAARDRDGAEGFKVYVAGGMGRKPSVGHLLHEFIPLSDVYRVAGAVKRVFAEHGNRRNKHAARLRFLWRSLGREKFEELYSRELENLRKDSDSSLSVVPVENRADLDTDVRPVPGEGVEFESWRKRYVSPQSQAGLYCVTIPLLLGTIDADTLVRLADFAASFGENTLRATTTQNLTLRNVPEEYLGNAYRASAGWTELCGEPRLMGDCIACAGASTCQLGICLPRGAVAAIRRELSCHEIDLDSLGDFRLNLSGCSNTCGRHVAADLGFFGKARRTGERMYPAYTVVAGAVVADGRTRMARELGTVSARDVPRFVVECLKDYLEERNRPATFAQYVENGGADAIGALCEKYRNVADFEDDKNYYYDWGADEPFSLAGRGTGECSAGLFDLIELDLEQVRALRAELEAGPAGTERVDRVYRLALASSRMLLITRGAEARSEKEVFMLFAKHFVDSGLVDAAFEPVVETAAQGGPAGLSKYFAEVLELSHAVERLYAGMDNALRFAGEQEGKPAGPVGGESPAQRCSSPDRAKDLRGVACPMNFVKTKLELSRMERGQLLEVLLDDGEPVENVPRSARAEGHEVVGRTKKNDHWSVLIRKGQG